MKHSWHSGVLAAGVGVSILATLAIGGTAAVSNRRASAADLRQAPVTAPALGTTIPAGAPAVPLSSPATTASLSPPPAPAATFVPEPVAPLTSLAAPDAFVQLSAPVTAGELAAVRAVPALTSTTVVSTGSVGIAGTQQQAIGVDPSTFRRVTPSPTATSDALWASIADGNLATEITHDTLPASLVGQRFAVQGRGTRQLRLGALAAFGLPKVSVVMSLSRGTQLGLAPRTGLIVSAPSVSPQTLISELADATGGHVDLLGPDAAEAAIAGADSAKGLPLTWTGLFQQAASTCTGLSWTVLAAIGQIESGDGANDGPSSKGAIGPMQFLPATFAEYAVDGDRDGKVSALDPYDAVPTAARMLCHDGAGTGTAGLKTALFAYNHADWYVAEVLALAARYR